MNCEVMKAPSILTFAVGGSEMKLQTLLFASLQADQVLFEVPIEAIVLVLVVLPPSTLANSPERYFWTRCSRPVS